MAPTKLHYHSRDSAPGRCSHQIWLLPAAADLPVDLPARSQWRSALARRDVAPVDLAKTPQILDLPDGSAMVLAMAPAASGHFERLTLARKALMLLLKENPAVIAIVDRAQDTDFARDAIFSALLNGQVLPARKRKPARGLERIDYFGDLRSADCAAVSALATANTLCRTLTALPPNELTPATYRQRIRALARTWGWQIEEMDCKRLRRLGAGAFCAVAQGSDHDDAAIVRLRYRPRGASTRVIRVALVGKGICFDTGGHNLKPARYMQGMHEDMNGSAVVLGLLQAVTELGLPVAVDAWLAIAHNHLSPGAYKQNDVITALDGTTIEIVHTDAEGRMVLADTLTLAARQQPDLLIDFATLTGSMHTALGSRYSGVFASSENLAAAAVRAGCASGERVCVFPMDEDYDSALDSRVADVKQCTMEGEADHILAARFLRRFTADRPWLHVDLSASSHEGGLGPVASNITGFGVAWGLHFINHWIS
ncbi:MAG: leucyl aminopeptidase family protein [Proteobacteria bacterium]|nr:leucyl aminopeptidase family protein [Pseudomonadota bacterium]HQR04187.1 leucyl aminopeptidase family protein [Rhodocyclaceae bacterium]